ncbi:hypothetical protein VTN96DRAFT_8667 [Rasamsonia emersonii]
MPLILARRARCIFRQLNLRETLPVSTRISLAPSHVRRVAQTASTRPSHLIAAAGLPKRTPTRALANSYATVGRPKKKTGRAKAKSAKKRTASKAKTAKAKKELTPEQVERLEARKRAAEIRALKKVALKEPKGLPTSGYVLWIQEKMKETKGGLEGFRELTSAYKTLSPEELEPYKRQAESNKAANAAAYESWVKSHTPLEIRQANLARRRLAKLTESFKHPIRMNPIRDDRQVKGVQSSFLFFVEERFKSGDLKHMSIREATKRIADEWRGLTEQEKEKYKRLQEADSERYVQEYRSAYGEDPDVVKESSQASV